jgi:hypothetical protein
MRARRVRHSPAREPAAPAGRAASGARPCAGSRRTAQLRMTMREVAIHEQHGETLSAAALGVRG